MAAVLGIIIKLIGEMLLLRWLTLGRAERLQQQVLQLQAV